MKGNNKASIFIIVIIIALLTFIALSNVQIGDFKIPGANDIRKGIDIKGGVSAILTPVFPDDYDYKDISKDLETARTIMENRLDDKRIFDRNINIDEVNNRIIVDIPWAANETNFNPQDTINELGKTALLTFQEVDNNKIDEFGQPLPTDKIVIHGMMIKDAQPAMDQETAQWVVKLVLNDEGAEKFREATSRMIGKRISIFMDDKYISAPTVNTVIPDGNAIITGQRDANEAAQLAATIRSGALPFKLQAVKVDSISPQLGQGAMDTAVTALMVAFLIVCLFMIFYYRVPGVLASIALLGLIVLQLLFLSWLQIPVTLPGIGGIILSIGMGVDANVIIFERIKEELKSGKTLRSSIDVGFKRAFTAVLDANVTTLITALVLYALGSGAVKGFAYTLGLGVILSFLTAVTASRLMLKSVSNYAKNHWLYGA